MTEASGNNTLEVWRSRLPRKEPTANMRLWMRAYKEECDRSCCFSPDCASINCDGCGSYLTCAGAPARRYVCAECVDEACDGVNRADLPGPNFCQQCFEHGTGATSMHWHQAWVSIAPDGAHTPAVRSSSHVTPRSILTLKDLTDIAEQSQEGKEEGREGEEVECMICCMDALPSFSPGCNARHGLGCPDPQLGMIDGGAVCAPCRLGMYKEATFLRRVASVNRLDGTISFCQSKTAGGPTSPPLCTMCVAEVELAQWHSDFTALFTAASASFQAPLPRTEALAALGRLGSMPAAATPTTAEVDAALLGGSSQNDGDLMDAPSAVSLVQAAAKELHKQPWLRVLIDAAAAAAVPPPE